MLPAASISNLVKMNIINEDSLYLFYTLWTLNKQVRIHESTVACDWAEAVMPENHEKK